MRWGGVSRIEVITPISNRKALMDNDLDTLATALYVSTDDLWKSHPEITPWRPCVGIAPRISDAELVTLAVMQALLGFTSERRWLRHVTANLPGMFPCLPAQPGYNKRLRKLAEVMQTVIATSVRTAGSGRIVSGWLTPPRLKQAGPWKPCTALTWRGGPNTGTARPTPATSGACDCTCSPPSMGSRSALP